MYKKGYWNVLLPFWYQKTSTTFIQKIEDCKVKTLMTFLLHLMEKISKADVFFQFFLSFDIINNSLHDFGTIYLPRKIQSFLCDALGNDFNSGNKSSYLFHYHAINESSPNNAYNHMLSKQLPSCRYIL